MHMHECLIAVADLGTEDEACDPRSKHAGSTISCWVAYVLVLDDYAVCLFSRSCQPYTLNPSGNPSSWHLSDEPGNAPGNAQF